MNIVETPCNLTVNTAGGDDVIRVGVLYESEPDGISTIHTSKGWGSAGAVHTLKINTGDGDDRVEMNFATGEVIFSGGEGDDLFYIQEYRYADRYEKYPIGEFGAYKDVETVIVNRLVDRYIVQPGDTLFEIAQMFGVTVKDLVAWNSEQIKNPNLIYAGQIFVVGPNLTNEQIVTERID